MKPRVHARHPALLAAFEEAGRATTTELDRTLLALEAAGLIESKVEPGRGRVWRATPAGMAVKIRRLLEPRLFTRATGDTITLGRCPFCGRNVTNWMASKTGVRCRYEGARFDKDGYFIEEGA